MRRIEVGTEVTEAHTVFIQPGLETTLLFKAPLARDGVELERRESFKQLEIGEHRISLVPEPNLKPETRLRLVVRFADGTTPTGVLFQLVVSSSQGERQVEVDRLLPSASGGVDLLTGLLVTGKMDAHGIRVRDIPLETQPVSPVKVLQATCVRSIDRVAVRLEVQLPEGAPWRMESAVLAGMGEKEVPLRGWPSTPLPPGRSTLVLEREAGEGELTERYDLEVHEAGGMRTLLLYQVQFP